MKSRPSGATSTWAPAPGTYLGGREGSGGRQKGHHEIKVDTKLTAPKGPLFPPPHPPTERWQVPGRTKSACQSRGPATAGPQGAARPRARATRPGPRAEPVRRWHWEPHGVGAGGWGLGPREGRGREGQGAGEEGGGDPSPRRWPGRPAAPRGGRARGRGLSRASPPRVPGARPCPRPGVYNPGFTARSALLRRLPPPPGPR